MLILFNLSIVFCLDFLLELIFLHLQVCILTENSHSLQQIECTWPVRPLAVVHYPSFSLPFTRCTLFDFLNTHVGILEKYCLEKSLCVFSQLETKFKDNANKTMTESEEPFKCFVKFSSTNLLESFRHCASSGMNIYLATETKGLFRKILAKIYKNKCKIFSKPVVLNWWR